MNPETWVQNLVAYGLQAGLVVGVGLLLPAVFRLRQPRVRLYYWQGLLLATLLLPWAQLGQGSASPRRAGGGAVTVWFEELVASGSGEVGPFSVSALLLLGLGLGVLVRLLWLLLGTSRLWALRRGAQPLATLPAPVREIQRRVGRGARFYLTEKIAAPLTYGWPSPVVLLPRIFPAMDSEAQAAIACHELLHVRRRDWLSLLLEEGVRAVLWFHPAVWMLLRQIALSREQAIDVEVVRITGRRRTYMETLVRMAGSCRRSRPLPVASLLHRSDLKKRIRLLLQEVTIPLPRLLVSLAGMCALLAMTAGVAAGSFPLAGLRSDLGERDEAVAGGEASVPLVITGEVARPVKIDAAPPQYTEAARKAGVRGRVVLEVTIDTSGKVNGIQVVKAEFKNRLMEPSDPMGLTEAAVEAVRTWEFVPAKLDGKPVAVFYNLTINFHLD